MKPTRPFPTEQTPHRLCLLALRLLDKGVGEDVESAGDEIEEAAEDIQR